jgi:hypothetical protein
MLGGWIAHHSSMSAQYKERNVNVTKAEPLYVLIKAGKKEID